MTTTGRVRCGAWVMISDSWQYRANAELYHPETMYEIPPHIATRPAIVPMTRILAHNTADESFNSQP